MLIKLTVGMRFHSFNEFKWARNTSDWFSFDFHKKYFMVIKSYLVYPLMLLRHYIPLRHSLAHLFIHRRVSWCERCQPVLIPIEHAETCSDQYCIVKGPVICYILPCFVNIFLFHFFTQYLHFAGNVQQGLHLITHI